MKRRALLAAPLLAATTAPAQQRRARKYVITTPRDLLVDEPVFVTATSRVEAVLELGLTVWTEEAWRAALDATRKKP